MFNIKGKTAIVTGCGGRGGIGRAVATAFLREGIDVLGVGRGIDQKNLDEMNGFSARFAYVAEDLTRPSSEQAASIVAAAVEAFGRVDILVNNAGIARREDAIDYREEDWEEVMNINLTAAFLLCQAAARQMLTQGDGGKIVNVASMLSYSGGIRVPSYAASKHGIAGITKALANEWAKLGINVNAIAPGYVDTPLNQAHKDNKERYRQLMERIPAERWATTAEIAGPVLFLCTEEAAYIHGFTLAVDGGWLAR